MTTDKAAAPVGAVPQDLADAIGVLQQTLLEVRHAQSVGPQWYTRGEAGLYEQVSTWLRKGGAAITTLEAALASQAARMGELEADSWQPISTAPLDGTRVLTCYVVGGLACDYQVNHFNDPGRRAPGHGLGSRGWWCSTQRQQPTHWRPLTNPADQGKRSAADPR